MLDSVTGAGVGVLGGVTDAGVGVLCGVTGEAVGVLGGVAGAGVGVLLPSLMTKEDSGSFSIITSRYRFHPVANLLTHVKSTSDSLKTNSGIHYS